MQRPKYQRIFWEYDKTKVNAGNLNHIERELETKLKDLEKLTEARNTGKLDSELASMFNESWEHLDKRQGLRKVISEVKDVAFKSDLKEKQ